MSSEIIAAIIGAIVGGFLAAGVGVFVEIYKNTSREKKLRELFKTAIIDDLKNALILFEKIQDDWNKSSLIWFVALNELRKSRQIYDKNSEQILLFESPELRSKISKYYLAAESQVSTLEYLQNRKYFIDNRKSQILLDIKIRNPELADEGVQKIEQELTKSDAAEKKWIDDSIPREVSKLDKLINRAQNLLDEIAGV